MMQFDIISACIIVFGDSQYGFRDRTNSGVARNYVYGGQTRDLGTEGAELGAVWGGVSPPQPTRESGGAS